MLEFYAIDSPLSQPRNMLLGQILSSVVGAIINKIFSELTPSDLRWLAGALACACALVVMGLTGTVHPPGGATALLAVTDDGVAALGWRLVAMVAADCALMLAVALLLNNVRRRFPAFWCMAGRARRGRRRATERERGEGERESERESEIGVKREEVSGRERKRDRQREEEEEEEGGDVVVLGSFWTALARAMRDWVHGDSGGGAAIGAGGPDGARDLEVAVVATVGSGRDGRGDGDGGDCYGGGDGGGAASAGEEPKYLAAGPIAGPIERERIPTCGCARDVPEEEEALSVRVLVSRRGIFVSPGVQLRPSERVWLEELYHRLDEQR